MHAVITMDQKVSKRTDKIFFDASMNARVKTFVVPYSARAMPGAPVAMPLTWRELGHTPSFHYTIANVPKLLARRGDIWADMPRRTQDVEQMLANG
jgi:bifunctional non-homologous end joining protein LigD